MREMGKVADGIWIIDKAGNTVFANDRMAEILGTSVAEKFWSCCEESGGGRALLRHKLARRIRETQTFVSICERGERRIDLIELRSFCKAFGLSLKQFVAALEREIGKVK
jgi:PAS domain-containing protein